MFETSENSGSLVTNNGSLARDCLAVEMHSLTVLKLSCFLLLITFLNKAAIVLSLSGLICCLVYYVEYSNLKESEVLKLPFNL